MTVDMWDAAAASWARSLPGYRDEDPRWETPGSLAKQVYPSTVSTPALTLIDEALQRCFNQRDGRLILMMPPQEGKSTRAARDFPTWVLKHQPNTRIITASYGQVLAQRNGRAVRNMVIRGEEDLGIGIAPDNGSVAEWKLNGFEGGLYSAGIGSGMTGQPADLMIIDDPIKDRKEADSELYRDNVWDWWTDVASTRLAPGASVVLILTRWHEDDLAGRLMKEGKDDPNGLVWEALRIPAQADHDPKKGERDPLGREPGEYLQSARRRTEADWERIKKEKGTRTWNALYQGRPTSATGTMFKKTSWRFYDVPLWIERDNGVRWVTGFDEVIQSWDFTFKDTKNADFVAGGVWGRIGTKAYLLDRIVRRMDFNESCIAIRAMSARWPQAMLKLVEDKANGPAIMASLRMTVPGMVGVEPDGGKEARAAAVSPLVEGHDVYLPSVEIMPSITDFIEQCASFPFGANDDEVDQMSQALNRLILQPMLAGGFLVQPEEYDEVDARGYYASPV